MTDGKVIPFPGVDMDNKLSIDERALLERLIAMQEAGRDGIEAGLKTTEFWLTAIAVVIDVAGPHYGVLQGIDASEQGLIAMALVIGYTALRSWRKRGGPAKILADLLAALGRAPQSSPPQPPDAATPAVPPAA